MACLGHIFYFRFTFLRSRPVRTKETNHSMADSCEEKERFWCTYCPGPEVSDKRNKIDQKRVGYFFFFFRLISAMARCDGIDSVDEEQTSVPHLATRVKNCSKDYQLFCGFLWRSPTYYDRNGGGQPPSLCSKAKVEK